MSAEPNKIPPGVTVLGKSLHPCIACGNESANLELDLPGDPLGSPEDVNFMYIQCSACKTLRLAEIPEDMSPYYSAEKYYSHHLGRANGLRGLRGLRQRLSDRGEIFGGPWPLGLLAARRPDVRFSQLAQLTTGKLGFRLGHNSRILDVGCGSGAELKRLAAIGFCKLTGADPFLANPGVHDGVRLVDKRVEDLDGTYDLIMCSHTFEHMDNPARSLNKMRRLLADGGILLLRVPLAGSIAWDTYGGYWVQLDAPRHITLFSVSGLKSFVNKAGFKVARIEYDSFKFMVLGSIARQRGILPHDIRAEDEPVVSEIRNTFGAFAERIAHEANLTGEADQATLFLTK